MAAHSSTLAWKIPWAEEPGRLQSMASLRVRHDWATSLSLFTFMHWRRKMATHSTVLAWRIPGTGEPGGLPSRGSHRWASQMVQWQKYKPANVGHVDLIPGFEILLGRKWQPSSVEKTLLPGKFRGQRSLVATVHGVTESWLWLSTHWLFTINNIKILYICEWSVHSFGKNLLAFALLHSVLQGQICLLLQVFLDSYFCILVPNNEKDIFFGC